MNIGAMKMAAKAGKKIRSMMKSPEQRRREQVNEIITGRTNPLNRMNDSARRYFARKNLK